MAIPTLPQSTGHQGQTPTETSGPGASTLDNNSARYRFELLSEEQKAYILDKYRDWNTEHLDWWDGVYDGFKEDMAQVGVEVDKMYFSGFWSQGDGACFEGHVHDWALFLKSVGYDDAPLIKHANEVFSFSVKHSGHYYHENCTSFSAQLPLPINAEDSDFVNLYTDFEVDSIQEAVWLANMSKYDEDELAEVFTEAFKDHMRALYCRLEEEHDYLTSDEAILDSLEINDQLEDAINEAMENCDA